MVLSRIIEQFMGIAMGALLFVFSRELASLLNRASVKLYEFFPRLKALPRSYLAGTDRNYKTTFYVLRALGVYLVVLSTVFLGLYVLHRP
jgi:hypothetical protein